MSYTCAICLEEFEENWSEEEAIKEMQITFGNHFTKNDCVVVCDDCYVKFMRDFKNE